jgi:hypothetical protein
MSGHTWSISRLTGSRLSRPIARQAIATTCRVRSSPTSKTLGVRAPRVDSAGDFRAEVLKDLLRAPLPGEAATRLLQTLARLTKPIVLPYPSLGGLFKGRDVLLHHLRSSLTRVGGGTTVIVGRAIHGLGGVGNTRVAVEYAWAHHDDYTALFLLDAETPEKLHTGLAALTGPLRLPAQAEPQEEARM